MSDLAEVVYREWKDKIDNGLTYEDHEKLTEVCVSIGLPFLELFEVPKTSIRS